MRRIWPVLVASASCRKPSAILLLFGKKFINKGGLSKTKAKTALIGSRNIKIAVSSFYGLIDADYGVSFNRVHNMFGCNFSNKTRDLTDLPAKTIKPLTRLLAREDISLLTALFQVVNKKSNSFSERRDLMDSVACLLEADYKMPHVLTHTLSVEINHLAKTGAGS